MQDLFQKHSRTNRARSKSSYKNQDINEDRFKNMKHKKTSNTKFSAKDAFDVLHHDTDDIFDE